MLDVVFVCDRGRAVACSAWPGAETLCSEFLFCVCVGVFSLVARSLEDLQAVLDRLLLH